jgi:hypothetical protein
VVPRRVAHKNSPDPARNARATSSNHSATHSDAAARQLPRKLPASCRHTPQLTRILQTPRSLVQFVADTHRKLPASRRHHAVCCRHAGQTPQRHPNATQRNPTKPNATKRNPTKPNTQNDTLEAQISIIVSNDPLVPIRRLIIQGQPLINLEAVGDSSDHFVLK